MRVSLIRKIESTSVSKKCRKSGYTLIEMAIVVSVVGLLMSSFISAYNIYIKTKAQTTTENNASLITAALGNFLVQNGRYPCPSRADVDRTSTSYGLETECDPLVTVPPGPGQDAYPPVVTGGTCTAGLCFEDGEKFVDVSQDPTNVCDPVAGPLVAGKCIKPKVRRGVIPFRALGISEDQAEDGWGDKFMFATTENLSVATSYVRKGGGIEVYDGSPVPNLLTPADNLAHYVVFSSGPDRKGAYNRYGIQIKPCSSTTVDGDNCLTNTTGNNKFARYRLAEYSTTDGTRHFDDYVKFYSSVEMPLWKVSDPNGFHITDLIGAGPGGGQVGIGVDTPATNATIDVAGEVRAENGNAHADAICQSDPSHQDCVPVDKFGGNDPSFQCGANQYARALGDASTNGGKYVRCVTANASPDSCDAGEVMTGVEFTTQYPQGHPLCSAVGACASKTVKLCNGTTAKTNVTIPSNFKGKTWISGTIGVSFIATYLCQSNGSWKQTGTSGVCVCGAADEFIDTSCNVWQGNGNWTGVVTQHHVHTCPADTDSSTVTANTCVCSPLTQTRTATCPSGLTGAITQQRDWICDSPNAGHWTSWTQVASTCTCTPASQTQTLSCGTGFTGAITQHQDFICPAAAWGSWVTDSNTCVCTGASETRTNSCPAFQVGQIDQKRDFNCATSTWGPWVDTANSCSCAGTTQNQSVTCPGAHQTGSITQQRTYNCATSSWGVWGDIANTCACVQDTEQQTIACTAPLLGNIIQVRTYDCVSNSWGAWGDAINNCGTVAYSWASKTAATGPFGAPLSVQQGASCSTPGASSSCSSPAGGGQYWHYATCQCE